MTTKPGDVDEEYMWNGYSQTTLAAICDAAEKYIGQYTEEHPYLAFEGNGLAKAILSALPAKPEQVWCMIDYQGKQICKISHKDLSDLHYVVTKAMREAKLALPEQHREEV